MKLKELTGKLIRESNISAGLVISIMLFLGYSLSFNLYDKVNFYQTFLLIVSWIIGVRVLYSSIVEITKYSQTGLRLFLNLSFVLTELSLLYFVPKELNKYSDPLIIYLIFGIVSLIWFIQDFLGRPKTYSFFLLSKVIFYFGLFFILKIFSGWFLDNLIITLRFYQVSAFMALILEARSLLYACQKYIKMK